MNPGKLFILGDSYSTFAGHIPEGYISYYPQDGVDVSSVEDTWWHMLISETDAVLAQNCSWSGSTICHTGSNGADCRSTSFVTRLQRLIEEGFFQKNAIDTALVFGGTNDSWVNSPLGEPQYGDWEDRDLYAALPAFAWVLQKLKCELGIAWVLVIFNTGLKPDLITGFREICDHYDTSYLQLQDIQKRSGHPDKKDMVQIKNQVLARLRELEA